MKEAALYVHHPGSCHGWSVITSKSAEVVVFHFTGVPHSIRERVNVETPFVAPLLKPDITAIGALGEQWGRQLIKPLRWREIHEQELHLDVSLLALERAMLCRQVSFRKRIQWCLGAKRGSANMWEITHPWNARRPSAVRPLTYANFIPMPLGHLQSRCFIAFA